MEKRGEKRKKFNKRKNYDTIFYLNGKKYFSPTCSDRFLLWEKKNTILKKGGGEEYDFWGKYIPLERCTVVAG